MNAYDYGHTTNNGAVDGTVYYSLIKRPPEMTQLIPSIAYLQRTKIYGFKACFLYISIFRRVRQNI
jgi:hypothetical protein